MLNLSRFTVKFALHTSFFMLLWISLMTSQAHAGGGYTSPGSRAFADSNLAGDYILAGDEKILMKRGRFENGLFLRREFPGEPSVATGAMLARSAENVPNDSSSPTRAIICVETKIHILSIDESGRAAKESTPLKDLLQLKKPRELRCAVNPKTGEWLALNSSSGQVILSNGTSLSLRKNSSTWTHVVHVDDAFIALGENGLAERIIQDTGVAAYTQAIKAPWPDLQNRDTLSTRGSLILRTGESQTSLVTLLPGKEIFQWSDVRRIAVNPCSENGGCGSWLGEDERWIIAGSWGTYVGRNAAFSRIKTPLLTTDSTSPGAALVASSNQFILIGDIDADVGFLPPEAQLPRFLSAEKHTKNTESRGKNSQRYLIWLKGKRIASAGNNYTAPNEELLFTYSPHTGAYQQFGDVIVFEGALPDRWPSDWAAVEQEIEFNALALANEWTPSLSDSNLPTLKSPWWTSSSGLKQAISNLKARKNQLKSVLVAVVDSGIDSSHPALKNVLHHNEDEILGNGIDDDANGLVDDDIGYDFVTEQPEPIDLFGHGTHVAGLINNAWSHTGDLGGAFNTKLRIFRALDGSGKSNSIDLSRAIAAAIRSKADLMNCSWGGGPETQALRDSFAAANASGMMIFTSAGNDGLQSDDNPPVPKRFPGVIAIGASTANNGRARFSNWGSKSVFAFAPGADITSTLPGARMGEKSGTSMASPIAASVGALLLGAIREVTPEWSREQQKKRAEELLCAGSQKNQLAGISSKCGMISASHSFEKFFEGLP